MMVGEGMCFPTQSAMKEWVGHSRFSPVRSKGNSRSFAPLTPSRSRVASRRKARPTSLAALSTTHAAIARARARRLSATKIATPSPNCTSVAPATFTTAINLSG